MMLNCLRVDSESQEMAFHEEEKARNKQVKSIVTYFVCSGSLHHHVTPKAKNFRLLLKYILL